MIILYQSQNVETVSITLYANGLIMFQGPFRPYSDPHTQVHIYTVIINRPHPLITSSYYILYNIAMYSGFNGWVLPL